MIRYYLRNARKHSRTTQKQMASRLYLSLRRYRDIECGTVDPTTDELQRLASALGLRDVTQRESTYKLDSFRAARHERRQKFALADR